MTEMLSVVTTYLGPVLALLVLLSGITEAVSKSFKPISGLIGWFRKKFGSDVEAKIDKLTSCLIEVKEAVGGLAIENEGQNTKLDKMQAQITQNEKNRLSDSIFRMGFYARQGQPINDREFLQMQDNYTKYHDKLHGNGRAAEEYEFVLAYYNAKGWVKPKPARQRKEIAT